ncbi:MAG: 50S ribosomal protein L3 [Candidatus Omnitrophica bacterium]|nr:50S ribosomal protein L3 [Candidatus Omnitrophota bacterium]
MPKSLLGKKIGMTTCFNETGEPEAVTVIEVGPCTALQVKTKEKDGYSAVQLGFDKKKQKHTTKPMLGHFKKVNAEPMRFIREVNLEANEEIKPGQQFLVDVFKKGDYVDVLGVSIGKGFQGGMKRWHWHGGKRTHGSMFHRAPGSIQSGPRLTKVTPGHHLPGHMGHDHVTVQNLEIADIDKDKNILVLKGAVPGPEKNYLIIRKSIKGKVKRILPPKPAEKAKPGKARTTEKPKKPAAKK